MREAFGNIWDMAVADDGLCITTNGTIKNNGEGVMGRGVALEAKQRFPAIAMSLGSGLRANGNHVQVLDWNHGEQGDWIAFPVKHNWWEQADPALIVRSALELVALANTYHYRRVLLPRPGCGNGGLDWADVKPLIENILDDRFVAVTR